MQPGGFQTSLNREYAMNLTKIWHQIPDGMRQDYGGEYYKVRNIFHSILKAKMKFILSQERLRKVAAIPDNFQEPDCQPVVDGFMEAALSKFPRYRYVIGRDAIFCFLPLSYLPECLQDAYLQYVSRNEQKPACLSTATISLWIPSKF